MAELADEEVDQLDALCRDILYALEEHGGMADSSEIRQFIGLDSRTKLNYRITEYLSPNEFVETHQPPAKPGNIPPRELTLTEKGEQALDALTDAPVDREIADRVDTLENSLKNLQSQLADLQETTPAETTGGGVDAEALDDLQQQVANIAMELENLKNDKIFDPQLRNEIDASRIGVLAMRDYLYDKFDDAEEECNKRAEKYKDEIQTLSD